MAVVGIQEVAVLLILSRREWSSLLKQVLLDAGLLSPVLFLLSLEELFRVAGRLPRVLRPLSVCLIVTLEVTFLTCIDCLSDLVQLLLELNELLLVDVGT